MTERSLKEQLPALKKLMLSLKLCAAAQECEVSMNYKMYSVKDELTGKFMNPMFTEDLETSDREAIRQFRSNMNNIRLWKDNPNDYSLWLVGGFDDQQGSYSVVVEKIIDGRSVIDVQNEVKSS